jgi:hypothetical protein
MGAARHGAFEIRSAKALEFSQLLKRHSMASNKALLRPSCSRIPWREKQRQARVRLRRGARLIDFYDMKIAGCGRPL